MKINVPLPFDHADLPDEFGTMAAVAEIGRPYFARLRPGDHKADGAAGPVGSGA